jgi:multicomponent Na+:H+ antiporter subunit E
VSAKGRPEREYRSAQHEGSPVGVHDFAPGAWHRTALIRGAMFLGWWFVLLPSAKPGDIAVGVLATIGATYASGKLLPPQAGRVHLGVLLMLLPRFAWLSLLAGIDVARRVFSPNMPLATGFVDYKTDFPRGHARNNFATITSLMPGTVPSGDGPDTIEFHCLDTGQPVAAQMAAEERLLARALVPGRRDD